MTTVDARPLEWLCAVRDSETLTAAEKQLWVYATHAGKTGGNVFPGDVLTAKEIGKSTETVRRLRAGLTDKGYLHRVSKSCGEARLAAVYQLTVPAPHTSEQCSLVSTAHSEVAHPSPVNNAPLTSGDPSLQDNSSSSARETRGKSDDDETSSTSDATRTPSGTRTLHADRKDWLVSDDLPWEWVAGVWSLRSGEYPDHEPQWARAYVDDDVREEVADALVIGVSDIRWGAIERKLTAEARRHGLDMSDGQSCLSDFMPAIARMSGADSPASCLMSKVPGLVKAYAKREARPLPTSWQG